MLAAGPFRIASYMLDPSALQGASDDIRAAALTGADWGPSLTRLAQAAGARGIVILHNRNRRLIAHLSNPDVQGLVDSYLRGKAPANLRQTRVSHDVEDGFRFDADDFDPREINRDPFYQDFLRPEGLGWHANARLRLNGSDEIAVSFKRELKRGPYAYGDRGALNGVLAALRVASDISGAVLEAETRGVLRVVAQPGAAAAELDSWGFVRRQHGEGGDSKGPLRVRRLRLCAAREEEQRALDIAVDLVSRGRRGQCYLRLRDPADNAYALRIVRVSGHARDVFNATAAIAVWRRAETGKREARDLSLGAAIYKLTSRETEIAQLLCSGRTVADVAEILSLSADGVRYHLKSLFEKTGTRRQAELVGLLMEQGD
jgi:DNA-binding CsgD family transcriptional regulator